MYESALYPTSDADADAFVAGQRHGTLIATHPDGHPQASILPFVREGERIELHCVREDPTFAALQANPRVTFLVSDFLAWSPHDWLSADDAGRATLHFRAVIFECEATWSTEPRDVAAALARLLASYEPDADYRPIVADDAFYAGRLSRLAAVTLRIVGRQQKFKTGPAASIDARREVARRLRERAEPGDARAADVIEQYLR